MFMYIAILKMHVDLYSWLGGFDIPVFLCKFLYRTAWVPQTEGRMEWPGGWLPRTAQVAALQMACMFEAIYACFSKPQWSHQSMPSKWCAVNLFVNLCT